MAFIGFHGYRLSLLLFLVIQGFVIALAQDSAIATKLE
jgi:hypothetical protein